jgi:hypothetical protein
MGRIQSQVNDAIKLYLSKNGINNVQVDISEPVSGRVTVTIATDTLLDTEAMQAANAIVWSLLPIGLMFEVVNVVKSPGENQALPVPEPAKQREFININTSDDVTMPVSKKGK